MGIKNYFNLQNFLTSHANIRNTAAQVQIVQARVPFIVNGEEQFGFFNTIGKIWNVKSSKITPIKLWDEYEIRVSFVPSSVIPTVITFEIDVNGIVIASKSVQPLSLVPGIVLTEDLNFYASQNMIIHGGILYVRATESVSLSNKSLKIKRIPVFH